LVVHDDDRFKCKRQVAASGAYRRRRREDNNIEGRLATTTTRAAVDPGTEGKKAVVGYERHDYFYLSTSFVD